MKQVTITIGMEYDKNHERQDKQRVRDCICNMQEAITTLTGGCTETLGRGVYKHDNGKWAHERCNITTTVCTIDQVGFIKSLAMETGRFLNQESVMVTVTDCEVQFL